MKLWGLVVEEIIPGRVFGLLYFTITLAAKNVKKLLKGCIKSIVVFCLTRQSI